MSHHPRPGSELTRRAVVAGSGVLAVSAALGACSGYGDSGAPAPQAPTSEPAPSANPGFAEPSGQTLGSTSEIPVGGGKVFKAQKVVVTQPSAGEFKAFSAVCTHAGCTVNEVAGGTIDCPCHGSKYAVADGSVVEGPAPRPLAARQITVSGDQLLLQS